MGNSPNSQNQHYKKSIKVAKENDISSLDKHDSTQF